MVNSMFFFNLREKGVGSSFQFLHLLLIFHLIVGFSGEHVKECPADEKNGRVLSEGVDPSIITVRREKATIAEGSWSWIAVDGS